MKIRVSSISNFFLFYSVLFYLNIIGFLGSSITNSMKGNYEEIAAGNPINQVSGVILLLLAIVLIYKSPNISLTSFTKNFWAFALIIIFFLVSLNWSEVPHISFRRIIAFTTLTITAFVIAQLYKPKYILELIYKVIVFSIILGFVWTILQGRPISIGIGDQAQGMVGIFSDKNAAARTYAYGLLIAFSLNKFKTPKQLAAFIIILMALATAHSASAIILSLTGIGIVVLFRTLKGKVAQANLITLVMALATLALSTYIAMILYDFLLDLLGRDPNLTNRAIIWELLTPYMLDKFYFGYGFGAFWASSAVEWFVERWGFIGNAHSGYFEVMLHGGIALFSLFLVLLFVFIKNNFALFIRANTSGFEPLYIAVFIIQLVVNYVAYVILNYSSFDMFLFSLIFFFSSYEYHNKTVPKTQTLQGANSK